jgi:hypothetical protein
MSDSDSTEFPNYQKAMRELQEAANQLRKMRGEVPKELLTPEPPFCSFCGKGKHEYRKLIQGPEVNICDECVLVSMSILEDEGYLPQRIK